MVGGAPFGIRQIVRSVVSRRNGKGAVWARMTRPTTARMAHTRPSLAIPPDTRVVAAGAHVDPGCAFVVGLQVAHAVSGAIVRVRAQSGARAPTTDRSVIVLCLEVV